MKPEQIHDALNFLDDRLIEETDGLRKQKRPSPWKKWTALAACLCLVLLGTVAAFSLSRGRDESAECISPETEAPTYEETAGPVVEDDWEGIGEAVPEAAEEFLVRIVSWKGDGFVGEIISEGESGFKPGRRVEIRLTEAGELKTQYPEGSLVCPSLTEPEINQEITETENLPVLYAEDLFPG